MHFWRRVVADLASEVLNGAVQQERHDEAANPHGDDVLEETKDRRDERGAAQHTRVKGADQVAKDDGIDGVDVGVDQQAELEALRGVGALHGPLDGLLRNGRNHADDGGNAPREHEVDEEHGPDPAVGRIGGLEHVEGEELAQRAEHQRDAGVEDGALDKARRGLHGHGKSLPFNPTDFE